MHSFSWLACTLMLPDLSSNNAVLVLSSCLATLNLSFVSSLSSVVKYIASVLEVCGSIPRSVKWDTLSPTARHRSDIFL